MGRDGDDGVIEGGLGLPFFVIGRLPPEVGLDVETVSLAGATVDWDWAAMQDDSTTETQPSDKTPSGR